MLKHIAGTEYPPRLFKPLRKFSQVVGLKIGSYRVVLREEVRVVMQSSISVTHLNWGQKMPSYPLGFRQ